MKKIIAVIIMLSLVLTLASCGGAKSDKLKIGIIQYMSHPSLDNCTAGIKAALEESGLEYDVTLQIGSSNAADSDCASFALNMASGGYDMIFAVATPAACSAFNATADTNIPVIFCAVTDPLDAKLVKTMEEPGYNCTGTSDVLDLDAQVDLIQAFQPEVKKIGVLYTSSEENSKSNLANFKKICSARGIEVIANSVKDQTEIPTAAADLVTKVDCINNFTDNNVVNNLSVLVNAANDAGIPVYGSEIEQVKNGCIASVSIDYVALGKVTGKMGVDVLKGADISKMAVKTISDATPVVNTSVANKLGIKIPTAYEGKIEEVK